jgi:hypothetical protein
VCIARKSKIVLAVKKKSHAEIVAILPTIVTARRGVYSATTVGKSKSVLDASYKSVFIVSE